MFYQSYPKSFTGKTIQHNQHNERTNTMLKTILKGFIATNITRNPIGDERILFRRTTSRYGQKGSFSDNLGYFKVSRNKTNGRFVKRSMLQKVITSLVA